MHAHRAAAGGRVWSCPSPWDPGQGLLHGRPPTSLRRRWVAGNPCAGAPPSPAARACAGLTVVQAPGGPPSSYPSCTRSPGPPDCCEGSRAHPSYPLGSCPRGSELCWGGGSGGGRSLCSQRLAGKQSLKRLSLNPNGPGAWGVQARGTETSGLLWLTVLPGLEPLPPGHGTFLQEVAQCPTRIPGHGGVQKGRKSSPRNEFRPLFKSTVWSEAPHLSKHWERGGGPQRESARGGSEAPGWRTLP